MRETTDILISGGGVAGLTAACAFGSAGFRVICVDPAPPVTEVDADGADLRTTAFLQPSIPVLQAAGLWTRDLNRALDCYRLLELSVSQPAATGQGHDVPSCWDKGWTLVFTHLLLATARSRLRCRKRLQAARSPKPWAELPTTFSFTRPRFSKAVSLPKPDHHFLYGRNLPFMVTTTRSPFGSSCLSI